MMGSFLTRGLVMIFGYAYPAYECFKTVEKNKPEIDQLRFWCQYWILVAVLTVFERVGDAFISWLPMYSEAKLAFFVYLWYPKTRGTSYVYDSFLRPYVAKHENEIDRNLLEIRARAGDIAVLYWQKAASYGQTRIFEILQYVASQSPARPRPAQQQQQAGGRQPPTAPTRQSQPTAPTRQPLPTTPTHQQVTQQAQQPQSRQPSNAAVVQQHEPAQEADPTPASPAPAVAAAQAQTPVPSQATAESTSQSQSSATVEGEAMKVDTVAIADGGPNPPPQEMVMEEAIRVTRGRLRKNRAATNR